ncbi:hypothetical protein AX15_006597 [Amanita polypyramis BW_CC]|nr:hypothetical protein AX15_006597 [Amanita polypyramis BW_CC]
MYGAVRLGTISNSFSLFPVIGVLVLQLVHTKVWAASLPPSIALPFSPGFDISKVLKLAQSLPSHSWEYGTAAEALLELYDPSVSVFGDKPFPPPPTLTTGNCKSLMYASSKIQYQSGSPQLVQGDQSAGDPASLGVSAYLLGKTDRNMADAATAQLNYVLYNAPKFWNGAISHRVYDAELWADFIYMAPPFIAYYGAATNNLSILQQAVEQCQLYRQILQTNNTSLQGAWTHILGSDDSDSGIWSTGNAWAAAGMARVLATVQKAPIAKQNPGWKGRAIGDLIQYIHEILDVAVNTPTQDNLLINYWNDAANSDSHGFGETSGTSLLAYVAYRVAVMVPGESAKHVTWADGVRKTLGGNDSLGKPHVTSDGIVTPAVNPLDWYDSTPDTSGSPEGQNFVVLMYAAWRDCVWAGVCRR